MVKQFPKEIGASDALISEAAWEHKSYPIRKICQKILTTLQMLDETLGKQGQTVELGDITRVVRTYKIPTDRLVKINGNRGLAISIALKEGANLIRLGEVIDEKIKVYNQTLPIGINITRTADQDVFVDAKVKDFINNVMQSVGIVLAVMLLFLGIRTGLVVASLIPMAILMSLFLMSSSSRR